MTESTEASEQRAALLDVADAAKTVMGFLGGFVKAPTNAARRPLIPAILALGRALDRLDALRAGGGQ